MADMVRRWEDPPEHGNKGRHRPSHERLADELRARPGCWAVIAEGLLTPTAGSLAYRIRQGRGAFAPRGSFEAKCVGGREANKDAVVYARYIGEQVPDAS